MEFTFTKEEMLAFEIYHIILIMIILLVNLPIINF